MLLVVLSVFYCLKIYLAGDAKKSAFKESQLTFSFLVLSIIKLKVIVNCLDLLMDKVTPTRDYKTRSPFLRHGLKALCLKCNTARFLDQEISCCM